MVTFTVNCHSAAGGFAYVQEAFHDQIAWRAAVGEEKISMLESPSSETGRVVDALIQANNGRHVVLAEIVEIRLRGVLAWCGEKRRAEHSVVNVQLQSLVLNCHADVSRVTHLLPHSWSNAARKRQ